MSLTEYKRKRTFAETPEPAPKEVPAAAPTMGGSFCVQRHNASRLHYDFRLEIGGTLKSWAVPKGPTLDPTPKHLAAMVEDHPIEYGGFEGNIPKGNYGGGSVMLWDRGTFQVMGDMDAEAQLARGDFKFRLEGEKLRGDFGLVLMKGRGKGNEWLLLKKKDAFAQPGWDVEAHAVSVLTGRTQEEIAHDLPAHKAPAGKSTLPDFFEPMGATLTATLPSGTDWLAELKWDGVRALCFVENGSLRIFTRAGNACERQYPELSVLPGQLKAKSAVLDGEIAVLNEKGVSEFALIQPRIMNSDAATVARMAKTRPVTLFLFDLLFLDGKDLRGKPLRERRALLESVVSVADPVRISEVFPMSADLVEAAREGGLEGLVLKRPGSVYESRRSKEWLKLKLLNHQEFVICGFTPGERDHFGALVLGLFDEGKLRWVGNVGTGFDQKTLRALREKMDPLVIATSPFTEPAKLPRGTVWVRPELVCEVKFSNWTPEEHLRAPVFLGLRNDKVAAATVREDTAAVKVTHADKIYFPRDGYTKADVIAYYDAIAKYILPHLHDRPLSLKRYPNGIDADYFFQKDTPESFPQWLTFAEIENIRYVLAQDKRALLYLTNLGCIDQNPWMSRVGSLANPDFVLIDLDPFECPFDRIVEAAQLVRGVLDEIGLKGYPKTTGGNGMHVYIPVKPIYTYDTSRHLAEAISRVVIARKPELFTTPRTVSKRQKGRVYFDHLQNAEGKTVAAPYVVRAYNGAPVATPLDWEEVVAGLRPAMFTIKNAPARFDAKGDLFAAVLKKPQAIEKALPKLEKLLRG